MTAETYIELDDIAERIGRRLDAEGCELFAAELLQAARDLRELEAYIDAGRSPFFAPARTGGAAR